MQKKQATRKRLSTKQPMSRRKKTKKTITKISLRREALDKSKAVLEKAKLDKKFSSLHRLEKAMTRIFGHKPDVTLTPLGIGFAEKIRRPVGARAKEITGTGTVRCTWSPLSCGADVDG